MDSVSAHDIEACRRVLIDGMAKRGCQVTASTEHPLIATGYDQSAFTCPHGTRFYLEPTAEQRTQWTRDGVR